MHFYFLDLFAQFAASLEIYQLEFVDGTVDSMLPVEGVATVPIGGSPPRHFAFNCISTTGNGDTISWSRVDEMHPGTQNKIAGGVQLDFENAEETDLTVYRCYDSSTEESILINITKSKWN